jgi:hypothetical protein
VRRIFHLITFATRGLWTLDRTTFRDAQLCARGASAYLTFVHYHAPISTRVKQIRSFLDFSVDCIPIFEKLVERSTDLPRDRCILAVMAQVSATLPRARVLTQGDGLIMAEYGPVCLALWRKKSTRERFERQKTALDEVVRKRPGEVAFVCVIESTSEPPDDDIRRESSQMITRHGAKLKGVACIIEGDGFRAAITRSVLSGIVLFIRNKAPIKMFATVAHASEWVRTLVPLGPSQPFLREVEGLRAQLGAP